MSYLVMLGKGLTDITTMPTPKHAVASAIGVELPQFSSFLCCLEQPPNSSVNLYSVLMGSCDKLN